MATMYATNMALRTTIFAPEQKNNIKLTWCMDTSQATHCRDLSISRIQWQNGYAMP